MKYAELFMMNKVLDVKCLIVMVGTSGGVDLIIFYAYEGLERHISLM